MSWGPIRPARIDFGDAAAPAAPDFGDVYHSRAGAWGQARHVFLGGNGLPGRWAGRARFVILETGFGLGNNFLATWAAWRADPRRPARLWYLSIEKHPPRREDLARALAGAPEPALAAELIQRWPPLTPDLHAIDFEAGRLRLLLAFGDVATVLRELVAAADAFYLDGFAPDRNPQMWDPRVLRGLHRLAAPQSTLATWCVAASVRHALATAGFELHRLPGFGAKREMLVGRFAPRAPARPPAGRIAAPAARVAVVGAGLAGAGAAQALAAQGLEVLVLERAAGAAAQTSGQPGGLLHGVVHPDDGPHARWLRAGALHAARDLAPRIASGTVSGALGGLWRGERRLQPETMQALVVRQALPPDYVRVATGPRGRPAWYYPGGGWASAPALVADWLRAAAIRVAMGVAVHSLERAAGGGWRLLGHDGGCVATADAVVLANACDLPRLWPASAARLAAWRAQTSILPAAAGLPAALAPIADGGYALRLADGRVLVGAASRPIGDLALGDAANRRPDDLDPRDHERNLDTLERLTGWRADVAAGRLDGRSGARLATIDRLPLVGPLPAPPATGARLDQPRFVPREPGLHVLGALGSRGIAQAALAGELLAARLTGAPVPAPASLIDALDAARFVTRAARRAAGAAADGKIALAPHDLGDDE
jgi:tRNA 5-methylaminomethyl-2-thiouridine biosynthesis bifunctional protein